MRLATCLSLASLLIACGSRSSLLDAENRNGNSGAPGSGGSGATGGAGGGSSGSGGSGTQPACANWDVTKTWTLPAEVSGVVAWPALTPLSADQTSFALTLIEKTGDYGKISTLWHFRIDPWQPSSGDAETLTGNAIEGIHSVHLEPHAVGPSGTPGRYALAMGGDLNGVDLRHSVTPGSSSPGPSTWLSAQYFGAPVSVAHWLNPASGHSEYVVTQRLGGETRVRLFVPETSSAVELGTCAGKAVAVGTASGSFVVSAGPCGDAATDIDSATRLQVSRYDGAELEVVFEQTEPAPTDVAVAATDSALWVVSTVETQTDPRVVAQRIGFDGTPLTAPFEVTGSAWTVAATSIGGDLGVVTFEPDVFPSGQKGLVLNVFDASGMVVRRLAMKGRGNFLAAASDPQGSALLLANSPDEESVTIRRLGCTTD